MAKKVSAKYELLIAEKPASAKKIAEALADKKAVAKKNKKVSYYMLEHKGRKIIVACAVGHLYGLKEAKGNGWTYPTFSYEWRPLHEINKYAKHTKDFIITLTKLAKDADEFTVCTDFDDEGTVLGLNALRFACNQKDAHRMKFSTLTKAELIHSYEHKMAHLDWGPAKAGITRHALDWEWGINTSRALTLAVKSAGRFKILSTGRVQGPALKIIVEKEKKIQKFEPVPFWQIPLTGKIKSKSITAFHKEDKFWEKKKAQNVISTTKNKKAFVNELKKRELTQHPPFPFDLTTLQTEAYRCFGISPKETQSIAQSLYVNGLISYPRTSSNKLPPALNYKKIISDIGKQTKYAALCKEILKNKKLKPCEGSKTDPAHPACHATGETPKSLKEREVKIYDLIVKRTIATFAEEAKRETVTIEIDVNKEIFVTRGTTTVKEGWHKFYSPYVNLKEEELPPVKKGDEIKSPKITLVADETKPPKRYTPSSIIKELEKRNLGTKATRANIVDTLYQRSYVKEKAIEATTLGISIINTLHKYCPEIIDEALTKKFEEQMELIKEGKKEDGKILKQSEKELLNILEHFKENEAKIGKELLKATTETQKEESTVGECKKCKKGTLILRRGRFGLFCACDQYPKCKTTFSVPSNALIKPAGEFCKECHYPTVLVIKKAKRPWKYCINKDCPVKVEWRKKQEELKKKQEELEKQTIKEPIK